MLKDKLKKAVSIFQWLLTAVLISVVLLLIFTAFNPVKSFQVLRVMSGSMEPKIKVGSVVFVQKVKPETLKGGNIITFTSLEDPNMSITHRLIATEEKEGQTVFKTKGDANNTEDMTEVSSSQIKGRVIFSLPFLGYLSVWIKQPLGFGLLVILPAILIIISEILNIKKTIEKEVEKKYAGAKDAKKEEQKAQKGKKFSNLSLLIFFLLGISLFQIKPTNAYFSDVIVVEGNTFSMADTWPSPPPTARVVINEVYYRGDSKVEWVELYNAGNAPVDLNGWKILDNTQTDVLSSVSLILNPDQFAVMVGTDNSAQVIASGAIRIILGNTAVGNGLAEDGDRLILKNNLGDIVDQMNYGNDTEVWNPARAGVIAGHSLARSPKGHDSNQPSDFVDLATPNPGTNPHPPDLTEPTPTPTLTLSPTPSPTPEISPTLTPTVEPSQTPSPLPETSPTPTPTAEPSPTPESSPSPSSTSGPTPTPTPIPTAEPTPVPSAMPTPSPSLEPSPEVSPTPTPTPTPEPSITSSPISELPTYGIA